MENDEGGKGKEMTFNTLIASVLAKTDGRSLQRTCEAMTTRAGFSLPRCICNSAAFCVHVGMARMSAF